MVLVVVQFVVFDTDGVVGGRGELVDDDLVDQFVGLELEFWWYVVEVDGVVGLEYELLVDEFFGFVVGDVDEDLVA